MQVWLPDRWDVALVSVVSDVAMFVCKRLWRIWRLCWLCQVFVSESSEVWAAQEVRSNQALLRVYSVEGHFASRDMEFFVKSWDNAGPHAEESRNYMRDYDAIDPCEEIAKVACPVLIVQGGLDQSGVIADNGERLYQARYAAHADATGKAFFPDLQHFYKRARPEMTSYESMQLDGETDERVSNAISAWLDSLI
jgi:pimeloyl-ACP methyl ester carboxylesterase